MRFLEWLLGRRDRIEPLLAPPPPSSHDPVGERQAQQMQQIRDVAARLAHAEEELQQAQAGLRTMKQDIKEDDRGA